MSCSSTLIMFSSVFLVIIIILVGLFVWYTKNNETKNSQTKSCETKSCETKPMPVSTPTNAPVSPSYPTYNSYPTYSYPTYRNPYYPQSLFRPDLLYSRNVYLDNVMNGYYPGYSYTWANGGNRGNDDRGNKNINNISVNVPSSGNAPSSGNENKK